MMRSLQREWLCKWAEESDSVTTHIISTSIVYVYLSIVKATVQYSSR